MLRGSAVKTLSFVVISLLVAACGKRGDPRPPVPVIPKATTDLVVTQRAGQVILSWSYPALTTAGKSLTGVERITVYRHVEEFPASAFEQNAVATGEKISDAPRPITLFSKLPTIPQAQFEKLSTKLVSIEEANLAKVTAGSQLLYTDDPPFQTIDGRPIRLTYAVVTEAETARSQPSNLAVIVPLAVAVPPPVLTASVNAEGVTLRWEEPKLSVTGQQPEITGYHVYRAAPGAAVTEFRTPINNAPVKSPTYTDTPPYGDHEYRVTAVASAGPPLIQSEVSAPTVVGFRDRVAPPAPATVTPLLEPNAIRLIWDPVEALDLAGYKIYRSEGVGHVDIKDAGTIPIVIQPIAETTFLHTPVTLGIAFRYAVTAVDKSGNESARTWTNWVVAPKTP